MMLDVDLLQTLQGVASGGRNEVATYLGEAEYTLHVDTQKLGLWPGGFLRVQGVSSFGQNINHVNRVGYTWSVYYNFDQYLWSPEGVPDRGRDVFFRFGASDVVANPIKYAYNVGIGAKGLWSWRPCDNFGIGWARMVLSDNFVQFLRQQLRLGLGHEDAIELYDNAAITPWLNAALDLQIIAQALERTLNATGSQIRDLGTAVVLGLRVYARC
jgi:porin